MSTATRSRAGCTRLAAETAGRSEPGAASVPCLTTASAGARTVGLVMGVSWQAILGADLRGQALRRARQAAATHWVHAGGRAESVGTVRLSGNPSRLECHAAAQIWAAETGAGTHAGAWRHEDGIWLVVARDGQVVAGSDQLLDAQGAAQGLAAAHARFGAGIAWHAGAQRWAQGGDLAVCAAVDLAALAARAGAHSVLQPRRGGRADWRLWGLAVGVLAALGAGYVAQRGAAEPPSVAPAGLAPEDDARYVREAWELAYARLARSSSMPDGAALGLAWEAVGELPLLPVGWMLSGASCVWDAAGWACDASYRRTAGGGLAVDLADALPGGWQPGWPSLDAAVASRRLGVEAPALRLGALPRTRPGAIEDADALQRMRAAFADVQLGPPQPLAVGAPVSPEGARLPRPDGLAGLQTRSLRLRGPWRSAPLLDALLAERVAWRRLALQIDPAAQPGLAESAAMADIEGVVYETQLHD